MKKKILTMFLIVCVLAGTSVSTTMGMETRAQEHGVKAYEVNSGDFWYEVLEDGTVGITYYNGSDTDVVIPAEFDGKAVSSIEFEAFRECTSLNSIIIPNGVTRIGTSAFRECISLGNITVPESVTSIETAAFMYCSSLGSIVIPESVIYMEDRFRACDNLTSIDVDEKNLNYSSVNGDLFDKEQKTLLRCPQRKTGEYQIMKGITSIADYAFYNCMSLSSVLIPKGVTSIGEFAFSGCES